MKTQGETEYRADTLYLWLPTTETKIEHFEMRTPRTLFFFFATNALSVMNVKETVSIQSVLMKEERKGGTF